MNLDFDQIMALIRTIACVVTMLGSLYYWYRRLKIDKKEGRRT